MAELGGTDVVRADLARVLNVESRAVSSPRHSLLDKGIIQIAGHGLLSFTAPGFTEHVLSLETH